MAIEVEQEKKQVNVINMLIGIVVVLSLFAGVYFFLFRSPEFIDVVLPRDLQNLSNISNIPFEPERVFNSEKYNALKEYSADISIPTTGKSNPFLP